MKDYQGALADLNRAIELKPTDIEGYELRAEIKNALGDHSGAAADEQKAKQLRQKR